MDLSVDVGVVMGFAKVIKVAEQIVEEAKIIRVVVFGGSLSSNTRTSVSQRASLILISLVNVPRRGSRVFD